MSDKKNARAWALLLERCLTDDEFSEFAEYIDSCDDLEFSWRLAALDMVRHPEKFRDPSDGTLMRIAAGDDDEGYWTAPSEDDDDDR